MDRNRERFSFAEFVTALPDEIDAILVGGQAINYWSSVFYKEHKKLAALSPFTSRDGDFVGRRDTLKRISKDMNTEATMFTPRQNMEGVIDATTKSGIKFHIDILNSVKGIQQGDFKKADTVRALDQAANQSWPSTQIPTTQAPGQP